STGKGARPPRTCVSTKVMPAYQTSTRTCPGPAAGSGVSSTVSTSDPPNSLNHTACTRHLPPAPASPTSVLLQAHPTSRRLPQPANSRARRDPLEGEQRVTPSGVTDHSPPVSNG